MTPHYRLRFFFDAGSGVCLWSGNATTSARYGIAILPEQLPLSPYTQRWVNQLVAQYDTSLNWDDPTGPSPWSPAECEHFNATAARALLSQIRAQLGEDYDVVDEFLPVR